MWNRGPSLHQRAQQIDGHLAAQPVVSLGTVAQFAPVADVALDRGVHLGRAPQAVGCAEALQQRPGRVYVVVPVEQMHARGTAFVEAGS